MEMTTVETARMLLNAETSALCVIDVQERLVPALRNPARLLGNIKALVAAAQSLKIPVLFTEHCPESIGHVHADLQYAVPNACVIEKGRFCATSEGRLVREIRTTGRQQVVVAGAEAHVCVLQTSLGLRDEGFEVFLTADAVQSRAEEDRHYAVERARADGVHIVTTEMVFFEWLADGRSQKFRMLLPLIKELKNDV